MARKRQRTGSWARTVIQEALDENTKMAIIMQRHMYNNRVSQLVDVIHGMIRHMIEDINPNWQWIETQPQGSGVVQQHLV